jgi:hypothetical protein
VVLELSNRYLPLCALAEDENGERVRLVGAESVSGTIKANGEVFTGGFHLSLISVDGGGLVGRVGVAFDVSANTINLNIIEQASGSRGGPFALFGLTARSSVVSGSRHRRKPCPEDSRTSW